MSVEDVLHEQVETLKRLTSWADSMAAQLEADPARASERSHWAGAASGFRRARELAELAKSRLAA